MRRLSPWSASSTECHRVPSGSFSSAIFPPPRKCTHTDYGGQPRIENYHASGSHDLGTHAQRPRTTRARRRSRMERRGPRNGLHQHPLQPPPIALAVGNLLRRPRVQAVLRYRRHYVAPHDLPLQMRGPFQILGARSPRAVSNVAQTDSNVTQPQIQPAPPARASALW